MLPLLVMGAVSLGSQLLSGQAEKKAAKEQERIHNEIARARNKAVLAETARNIGEMNRQRTVLNMQTTQALFHTGQAGDTARSDLSMLQGVTDSIGSTSQVLLSDVERQESEAKAVTMQNLETEHMNLNASLGTLINSGISQYSALSTGAGAAAQRKMVANMGGSLMQLGASAYTQGLFKGGTQTSKTITPVGTQGLQLAMTSKR